MIEICPICGDSYDTAHGCTRCTSAFRHTTRRLHLYRRLRDLVRALHRSRLLAAVQS